MKETLEEASEEYAYNHFDMHEINHFKALKQGFEAGAKYIQKQMFSEEEVKRKSMTYEQFHKAIQNLKRFMDEQDKLKAVLQVISPTSTGVVEFGSQFIDDYINVLEQALRNKYDLVSWFIFENEFGQKNMIVTLDGKEYVIASIRDIYDFIML